jgi:Kelch motif
MASIYLREPRDQANNENGFLFAELPALSSGEGLMQGRAVRAVVLCGWILAGACATPQRPGAAAPAAQPARQPVRSEVPQWERPVTSFGAAAQAGLVYALGGYSGVPHAYSIEGQSGELVRFDPGSGRFETLWRGEGVQGAQLVASERGLVRVGGMRARNRSGEPEQLESLREVALWQEEARAFQALAPLPEARSSHAAVALGGKLYVIGGWTLSGARNKGKFAERVAVLDLASNTYSELPQPFRVRAHAAGVLDGKIVVVGGLDDAGQVQRAVRVLDPASGSWANAPDYPEDAFGIALTGASGALFASARDGVVRRLAQPTGSFEPCAALAFPRFFHQLVGLPDGRIAALGGISGMHNGARTAHVELFDPAHTAPRLLSFVLQNPGAAKNRQGVALSGDSLLLFGGNRSLGQHDFAPEDFLDETFELDLATLQTRRLPSFPARRQTMQTVVLEDASVLALGGFGHDGASAHAHADAYLFEAEGERWLPHASRLPSPRTQFGFALHEGALWVFGGLDFDPGRGEKEEFQHPLAVLKAKLGEPFAETGIALPHARRAFGGALLDGRYYLVGGMAEGFGSVQSCDVFEIAAARWSELPCPTLRISPQLLALDRRLYLVGGSSPGEGGLVPNKKLEVFDPAAGSWSTLIEELPIEPRHLSAVVYRHALVLYSAHQEDGSLRLLVVVPPLH